MLPVFPGRGWDAPGARDVTGRDPVGPPTFRNGLVGVEYATPLTDVELDALTALLAVADSGVGQILGRLEAADAAMSDYLTNLSDSATAAQVRAEVTLLTRTVLGLVRLAKREARR